MSYYNTFHGEYLYNKYVDELIREYFPDYKYKGVFFDIGAFDPITISNSYHFEKNGWACYLFEANPNLIPNLKNHRKNVYNYAVYDSDKDNIKFNVVFNGSWTAGYSAVELSSDYDKIFPCHSKIITQVDVPQRKLDTIIENDIPDISIIDVMSLDIEGGELKMLKGFNLEKYHPKLIVVENVTNDIEIKEYLMKYKYTLNKQVAYNQFYLHESYNK